MREGVNKVARSVSKSSLPAILALVCCGMMFPISANAEQAPRVPTAHYTDAGSEGCLRCHGGDNMLVVMESAHGDQSNPHAPFAEDQAGREACHGPGSLHVSRSRGGAGFPPLARFGRGEQPTMLPRSRTSAGTPAKASIETRVIGGRA